VTALYDRQIGPGHLYASVSAVTTDDVAIARDQNAELFYVDGYTLFNARVAYEWDLPNEDTLTIEAVGKNLGDKTYQEQRLFLGNGLFQGWAPPRTWALSVSYMH
jgi:outer membrane receptor protein involved in Fe transport